MTGGSLYAAAIGGALLIAASAPVAFRAPANLPGGPETLLHKAVFTYELNDLADIPYNDDENYCWQQVWTASNGWIWMDVCHGYVF